MHRPVSLDPPDDLRVRRPLPLAMYGTYKGKSMRPGGGGKFARMKDALIDAGHTKESALRIAASHGRKKYGKVEFSKMAARGRKRASKTYTVPV